MPSRNVLKIDAEQEYYHVYARGISKLPIFHESQDYDKFLHLIARYLSQAPSYDSMGREYPHLHGKIELLSYCLMTNHFHLLFYQVEESAMKTLMQCLMASYVRYFNATHKRSGPLFESRYKAAMIINQTYLEHISRYIHLNPKDWSTYPYSSLHAYVSGEAESWLQPKRILDLFESREAYKHFVADYESHKIMLAQIKYDLAES